MRILVSSSYAFETHTAMDTYRILIAIFIYSLRVFAHILRACIRRKSFSRPGLL
jgi:hypothetical protein